MSYSLRGFDRYTNLAIVLIILSSCVIFASGALSEVSLGDENTHYRFAELFYENGARPVSEPLFDNNPAIMRNHFSFPFLWHAGLVAVWKALGRPSFVLAQAYHTLYFAALLMFTFLVSGKLLKHAGGGLYSLLLLAGIPVVAAFGVLFYMDVPAAAVTMMTFYLVLEKRWVLTAAGMILMYMTKQNACFLIPFFFAALIHVSDRRERLKIAVVTAGVLLIFVGADVALRGRIFPATSAGDIKGILTRIINSRFRSVSPYRSEYLNSYISRPLDLIKYLGIPFLAVLFYGIFTRKFRKGDLLLFLGVASYFVFYFLFFRLNSDIRYILPVIPLAVIPLGRVFYGMHKGVFRNILVLGCVLQLLLTGVYVNHQRSIPDGIKAAYAFIEENVPKNATIAYSDYAQMLRQTRRLTVWLEIRELLRDLFWGKIETVEHVRFKFKKNGEDVPVNVTWPWSPETGKWYHIALVRDGDTIDLAIDGVFQGRHMVASPIEDIPGYLYVGSGESDDIGPSGRFRQFYGYLDEVRISKGAARWTDDFNVPGAACMEDEHTKLLLHFDVDGKKPVGAPGQIPGPFGDPSLYLDDSATYMNDHVAFPDHEDWTLGGEDFTMDMWVNFADKTHDRPFISHFNNVDDCWVWRWEKPHKEFRENGIDYFVLKKGRTYDDSVTRHLGGYPASFVAGLGQPGILEKVFDNEEITVYKIDE